MAVHSFTETPECIPHCIGGFFVSSCNVAKIANGKRLTLAVKVQLKEERQIALYLFPDSSVSVYSEYCRSMANKRRKLIRRFHAWRKAKQSLVNNQ